MAFSCHGNFSLQSLNVALVIIPVSSLYCSLSISFIPCGGKKGNLVLKPGFPCVLFLFFLFLFRIDPSRLELTLVGFVEFDMACAVVRIP